MVRVYFKSIIKSTEEFSLLKKKYKQTQVSWVE